MKKIGMGAQILIALVLGTVVGVIFTDNTMVLDSLNGIGQIFLNLIKMIVNPLILCTIVDSISNMNDVSKLRRIGGKTLGIYAITTIGAALIAVVVASSTNLGVGLTLPAAEAVEGTSPTLWSTLINMVPSNPFASMASGNLIQIIVFAAFVGVAITVLGEKAAPVKNVFKGFTEIMYKITSMIIAISPIGIFALIAYNIGIYGMSIFGVLGQLIITVYIIQLLVVLLMYAPMIKFGAKRGLKEFFKYASKVFLMAFTTTSSAGTLPLTMKTATEDLKIQEDVANFMLPLGATINMNGAVGFFACVAVMAGNVYGDPLSMTEMIIAILMSSLMAMGMPGIPGGGIVLSAVILTTLGFPTELCGLIAGVHKIIDMADTGVNVLGDLVSTTVINKTEEKHAKLSVE